MHHHHHRDDHDDMGGLHRDLAATGAVMDRRRHAPSRRQVRGRRRDAADARLRRQHPDLADDQQSAPTTTPASGGTTGSTCSAIPQETAGPYPGDGSNGPNVLSLTGVVRSDIRSSFAGLNGVADGIPLNIVLTIVSKSTCSPLAGQAVYLWHCDRPGRYSLYTAGVTNQNFLRGVQAADANGQVTFTSIFPGCYAGRWPHIHFEVYPSLSAATNVANKIATSQIALPKAASDLVYATSGYESSVTNLSRITLATDNVFSDGAALELATMSGSVASGLTASLTVAV